ncbi:MAG: glycosyltransferase family 4 protein, partial [Sinomicrobium sp.]|nr:glycosyltransferase family 4 protein [Sinomicrobium sp.]
PWPSIYSFWGLQNWGLIRHLWKAPKSVLVVNGWQFLINIVAIVAGKALGHTVCLRGESPIRLETTRSPRALFFRKIALGKILFRFVDFFLFLGQQNKKFYHLYGINDAQLIPSPYSVDNRRFREYQPANETEKAETRRTLNLPADKVLILFSGKYMPKKHPMDLLRASLQLPEDKCAIIMMGEGELRPEMEQFIRDHKRNNIVLTGFINQADIPRYYSTADIFVMCSDAFETWGLSVNEAMNLALPLVLSGETGCSEDLVRKGENGFTYPLGNVDVLAEKLQLLVANAELRQKMGEQSLRIVETYSYEQVISHLKTIPHA